MTQTQNNRAAKTQKQHVEVPWHKHRLAEQRRHGNNMLKCHDTNIRMLLSSQTKTTLHLWRVPKQKTMLQSKFESVLTLQNMWLTVMTQTQNSKQQLLCKHTCMLCSSDTLDRTHNLKKAHGFSYAWDCQRSRRSCCSARPTFAHPLLLLTCGHGTGQLRWGGGHDEDQQRTSCSWHQTFAGSTNSGTMRARYCWDPRDVNGAKPVMKKWRRWHGKCPAS